VTAFPTSALWNLIIPLMVPKGGQAERGVPRRGRSPHRSSGALLIVINLR
jgi:hypothetical protein